MSRKIEIVKVRRGGRREITILAQPEPRPAPRPLKPAPAAKVRKPAKTPRPRKPHRVDRPIGQTAALADAAFAARFPAWRDGLPLEVGVEAQLIAVRKELLLSKRGIRRALEIHCSATEYLARLAAPGAIRHALDGTPIEPVSDEHREHARDRLTHGV